VAESLTDEEQRRRSLWFRDHWVTGVAFNRWCRMRIDKWDEDGVDIALPYTTDLSAHDGIFHGGVVGALLDTTATAAVMAGHDFNRGSRLTTISMSVQYLSVAPGEDLVCEGRCVRRGRAVSFAQAKARGATSGKPVATGQVSVSIAGERPGAPWASSDA
jgi:uncharacterized protein (TIGR00369 family)